MGGVTDSPGRHGQGANPPSDRGSRSRRSFFGALLGVGSFCVTALLAVPLARFALFPLLRRTTELKGSPVGSVSDFASLTEPVARTIQIEQVDGWRKAVTEKTVYLTKDSHGQLAALSSICPHLGCVVPWVSSKQEFACPCHGARYSPEGGRISGPSLRGMDTLETSVEDGQVLVHFRYFRQLVADKEVIG